MEQKTHEQTRIGGTISNTIVKTLIKTNRTTAAGEYSTNINDTTVLTSTSEEPLRQNQIIMETKTTKTAIRATAEQRIGTKNTGNEQNFKGQKSSTSTAIRSVSYRLRPCPVGNGDLKQENYKISHVGVSNATFCSLQSTDFIHCSTRSSQPLRKPEQSMYYSSITWFANYITPTCECCISDIPHSYSWPHQHCTDFCTSVLL